MSQYASVAAVTQSYDNNGNLSGDGTWTFGYDAENRLTSATKVGVSASYVYDPFGRREQKTVGSVITKYLLDGPSVIEEYDGINTRTARYVYTPAIDEPIFMERGGNRYFYHFDGSGSVAALTGTNGIVSERYAYGPYGETASTSAAGNPYRYTGRELDAETGLYYYRARYYSVSLGRFLQPDPLGYADGMNLYAYVGNDPLNLLDPDGLLARETATKAYGVYNNLASGLISQPARLPPPGTPFPPDIRPDFVSIQTNYGPLTSSISLSSSGKIFVAPLGVSIVKPNPVSASLSITFGYINSDVKPDNFLAGYAGSGVAAFNIAGGGFATSPGSGTAILVGLGQGVQASSTFKKSLDVNLSRTVARTIDTPFGWDN